MIHKQSSNRLVFFTRKIKNLDNDRCLLCNEFEDAKHLLISCQHKLDIWDITFEIFLDTQLQPTQIKFTNQLPI